MNDILFSADRTATNSLVSTAMNSLGSLTAQGRCPLGGLNVDWCASGSVAGGGVDLSIPGVVRLQNITLEFTVGIGFTVNLASILPKPKGKSAKWPALQIPRACHSDRVKFANNFSMLSTLNGPDWQVNIEMINLPDLQLDAIAERFIAQTRATIGRNLQDVPNIKPHMDLAMEKIFAMLTLEDVKSFIEPVLNSFLSNLTIPIYSQPQLQSAVSPCFRSGDTRQIRIDDLCANVKTSGGGSLVLSAKVCHI